MMRTEKKRKTGFSPAGYLLMAAAELAVFFLCLCLGSVTLPLRDILRTLADLLGGRQADASLLAGRILPDVRLPHILCAALSGAALAVSGCSMQGLLRNPLADGSTLGVSQGAALGAVISIAFGLTFPGLPFSGIMICAILAAFLSLVIILGAAWRLDASFSTNSIILIGIVFSMLGSALTSLVVTFAGDRLRTITFWNMGSLQGTSWLNAAVLLGALVLAGTPLLFSAEELNAFSVGEDNARSVGIDVRKIRLRVLICVSVLIGVCVSIGGSISFVGLVTPHMLRRFTGPDHHRLLPASLAGGSVFLMLADLAARTVLRPRELPIGVVTSVVGCLLFFAIIRKMRRGL